MGSMSEPYLKGPRGTRWPFSKGLVAESLQSAGLSPELAQVAARRIAEKIKKRQQDEISPEELKRWMVQEVQRAGQLEAAERIEHQTQSFEEILVNDDGIRQVFSKGLLRRSLEESGLTPKEADLAAKEVEHELRRQGCKELSAAELEAEVARALAQLFGDAAAQRYRERLALGGGLFVADGVSRVPFSRGVLAQSVMNAGVATELAYQIARQVERSLRSLGITVVDHGLLRIKVAEAINDEAGPQLAQRYQMLRHLERSEIPVQILIGGVTGVGKSAFAAALAHRLGITHLIGTDMIREILRATVPQGLVPTLHASSYDAWQLLVGPAQPDTPSEDLIVRGFLDHVSRVAVGVRAIQERTAQESLSAVIEGIHVVPGMLAMPPQGVFQISFLVALQDERTHLERFATREALTGRRRRHSRYTEHFHEIRTIQRYLIEQATVQNMPVIPGDHPEQALEEAMEVLTERLGAAKILGER